MEITQWHSVLDMQGKGQKTLFLSSKDVFAANFIREVSPWAREYLFTLTAALHERITTLVMFRGIAWHNLTASTELRVSKELFLALN